MRTNDPMRERRKHDRYRMPRGTFAILRDDIQRLRNHKKMGIGEIAMVLYKANPERMGQVVDLSIGGVAFYAPPVTIADVDGLKLDLLMAEQGIYIHDIPFEVVDHDNESDAASEGVDTPVNAIRFLDLDAHQKNQLFHILDQYADQR